MADVSKIAIQIASEFTGSKAFKQAETSTQKLQKQVSNLAKTLGVAFGTAALVRYAKTSVKAFAADDNAARSLSKTLENLGLSTQYAGSELNGYISRLEQQTGVLDDELRPAMDRLLRATGDVTKSQELLALALDISAGTGKDLTAVSQGLQKAYLGNNASLGRLGVGLTKAELKSDSFLEIQTKLTTLFAGQAKDAADSFQGSLNKLTVASNNAKEAIGKGLVEALSILTGGGGSVDGAVSVIDKMAKGIADGAKNIAFMIKQFEALKPVIIAIGALLLLYFAPVTAAVAALGFILAKGGQNLKKSQFAAGKIPGGMGNVAMTGGSNQDQQKYIKLQKQKNALLQIENRDTISKLKLTAGQQALEELKKQFDLDRIQINAALNGNIDKETELRLKSLMAIQDNDEALALKIKAELEAAETAKKLAAAQDASLKAWGDWMTLIGNALKNAAMGGGGTLPEAVASDRYAPGDIPGLSGTRGFAFGSLPSIPSISGGGGTVVNYVINASGIGDQQIASVVQGAIQDLNRYGNSITYAGAI